MVALLVVLPAVSWGLRVIEVGQNKNCWKEVKTTDTKADFKYY